MLFLMFTGINFINQNPAYANTVSLQHTKELLISHIEKAKQHLQNVGDKVFISNINNNIVFLEKRVEGYTLLTVNSTFTKGINITSTCSDILKVILMSLGSGIIAAAATVGMGLMINVTGVVIASGIIAVAATLLGQGLESSVNYIVSNVCFDGRVSNN